MKRLLSLCFLLLLSVAAGCNLTAKPTSLAGTRWQLVDFTGSAAVPIPAQLTGLLEFREETFVLDVGCNDLSAFYSAEGERLIIQPGVRTLVNCADAIGPEGMALENALFAALPTFESYAFTDEALLRIGYRDGELLFRPASETVTTTGPALNPTPDSAGSQPVTRESISVDAAPTPDPTAVAIVFDMEADTEALVAFMRAAPDRAALFGGVYLDHTSPDLADIAGSRTVLQLVGSEQDVATLRSQLPTLALPDKLQIERVSCAYDHLQTLNDQLLASPLTEEGVRWLAVDVRANRVILGLATPAGAQVMSDLTIDKATLPSDLATLVADPCIVVVATDP